MVSPTEQGRKPIVHAKEKPKPQEAIPNPSASIILVSPSNQVLLLHRVRTSSSFPSAHVFPGGNISENQDGPLPAADSSLRHVDSDVYRRAAIRECFEESGILLAKRRQSNFVIDDDKATVMLHIDEAEKERARNEVHANRLNFGKWVMEQGAELDSAGLLPFTRWITPPDIPKRFTTQMYLYFLPLLKSSGSLDSTASNASIAAQTQKTIIPSPDGGVEHTAARFEYASTWLSLANPEANPPKSSLTSAENIILFPPQYFLLHLIAPFLPSPSPDKAFTAEELASQRQGLHAFLKTSSPAWAEKCISPLRAGFTEEGRVILRLDRPGPSELEKEGRKGDDERCAIVHFTKEGPRRVEVRFWRDMGDLNQKGGQRIGKL